MRTVTYIGIFSVAAILVCCNPQKRITGYYTTGAECMGVELDGSQTLKTWGVGRNRFDAVEQAKKNAVNEVLFKGIRNGQPGCDSRPVLVAGNAREKYKDYFFKFFADKGPYLNYISLKDESLMPKIARGWRFFSKSEVSGHLIVRVKRNELRNQLIKDNIIDAGDTKKTPKKVQKQTGYSSKKVKEGQQPPADVEKKNDTQENDANTPKTP